MSLIQCVTLVLLIGCVSCHPVEVLSESDTYNEVMGMEVQEDYQPEFFSMVEEPGQYQDGAENDTADLADTAEAENADLDYEHPLITYGDIAVRPRNRNAVPCTATGCKWPKNSDGLVYVPVEISTRYNQAERNVIIRGLNSLHSTTCIRIVQWRGQKDYIYIFPEQGCWSYLGRQGGKQELSLQKLGCVYHHTVQHELLHALGFHHEQSRSDRDNHITILRDNILAGMENNFNIVATNNLLTPYDYNSVMQYDRYAFSKSPSELPTMVPKPNPNVLIGGAKEMSRNDILRVNRLYNSGAKTLQFYHCSFCISALTVFFCIMNL